MEARGDRVEGGGWRSRIGTAGAVFLGLVLLVAAWGKAIDPGAFAEQIEAEGLQLGLGAAAVATIALALEIGLGAALLLGLRRSWVLAPAALLVAFFLFLTGRSYWRFSQGLIDESEACGCFGNLLQRSPSEAFWQDLLLLVPALLLSFVGRRFGRGVPFRRLAAVAVAVLAGLLLAWRAPDLPLDDLATRLRPGVRVGEICAGAAGSPDRVCLDALASELERGRHLVLLAALRDETFLGAVDRLNDHALAGAGPRIWVLTDDAPEVVRTFAWTRAPAFEVREAPRAMLRPLYRSLPRAFLLADGVVVETWAGLPPLASRSASVQD